MLHGNFTHHSVLLLDTDRLAVTGFDKAVAGIQIQDFYLLFRKIMEKWDWDVSLGDSVPIETISQACGMRFKRPEDSDNSAYR